MDANEFDAKLFKVVEAFVGETPSYESLMDDLTMDCTDEQWQHVVDTLDMVRDPDFIKGELPPETIIDADYCDWGHGGVEHDEE